MDSEYCGKYQYYLMWKPKINAKKEILTSPEVSLVTPEQRKHPNKM